MNDKECSSVVRSNVSATDWEDYPMPEEIIIEGRPLAKVHWLHASGAGQPGYYVGLWSAEPSRFNYTFEMHESAHLLEGHVIVSQEEGPTLNLLPGDIAYFPKGARTVWDIKEPMKKFFIDTD